MNAEQTLKLARRFIELTPDKRRLFLKALQAEGMDFAVLPIPAGVAVDARDGLSYAQRRMWFLWQLDPQGAAYNLPMAVRLQGELDLNALRQAFDGLVARHETLRTRFVAQGDDVCQQVEAVAAPLRGGCGMLRSKKSRRPGGKPSRSGICPMLETRRSGSFCVVLMLTTAGEACSTNCVKSGSCTTGASARAGTACPSIITAAKMGK